MKKTYILLLSIAFTSYIDAYFDTSKFFKSPQSSIKFYGASILKQAEQIRRLEEYDKLIDANITSEKIAGKLHYQECQKETPNYNDVCIYANYEERYRTQVLRLIKEKVAFLESIFRSK